MNDLIERQAAIELIKNYCENGCDIAEDNWCPSCQREQFIKLLKALPSAQLEPSEITDEQAILHLQSTGWMQNHDREMYESGLREQLADDGGSYDSLIPCEDAISRQAAIDKLDPLFESLAIDKIKALPSAQSEIIQCKDCKHHHRDNNGTYYCGRNGYGWRLNDFCSDAERRTNWISKVRLNSLNSLSV